jgi:uncharacterized membrane-anchored protein
VTLQGANRIIDRELKQEALTKVPAVTVSFWIIKILATTLGALWWSGY